MHDDGFWFPHACMSVTGVSFNLVQRDFSGGKSNQRKETFLNMVDAADASVSSDVTFMLHCRSPSSPICRLVMSKPVFF